VDTHTLNPPYIYYHIIIIVAGRGASGQALTPLLRFPRRASMPLS